MYVLGSHPLLSGRHVTVIASWRQTGASYYFMADGTITDFQKCSSIVACIICRLSVFTFFAHSDFPKVFTSFVKTLSFSLSLSLFSLSLSLYIYIYIHTYTHTYTHTYIHTYIHTYTHIHYNRAHLFHRRRKLHTYLYHTYRNCPPRVGDLGCLQVIALFSGVSEAGCPRQLVNTCFVTRGEGVISCVFYH